MLGAPPAVVLRIRNNSVRCSAFILAAGKVRHRRGGERTNEENSRFERCVSAMVVNEVLVGKILFLSQTTN